MYSIPDDSGRTYIRTRTRQLFKEKLMDQEQAKTEAKRIGQNAQAAGLTIRNPDDPKLCELLAECQRAGVRADSLL